MAHDERVLKNKGSESPVGTAHKWYEVAQIYTKETNLVGRFRNWGISEETGGKDQK